ncbi:MAG: hypothetical protein WDA42_06085 [Candidatus Bathyarchaeia archaeon]|jgi:hypothetical protein
MTPEQEKLILKFRDSIRCAMFELRSTRITLRDGNVCIAIDYVHTYPDPDTGCELEFDYKCFNHMYTTSGDTIKRIN